MKTRSVKTILSFSRVVCVSTALLLTLVSASQFVYADKPSARQLMDDVGDRYAGKTRTQVGTLLLIDDRNKKRTRQIHEITKDHSDGEKLLSFIESPAELKGTSFLAYEWDETSRSDENWLYLPQLDKVKRLATNDESGYFFGSDFTYADVSGLDMEDFDHEYANPEEGFEVVVSLPKSTDARRILNKYGYKKVQFWVDAEKLIVVKAKYWLKEGHRIKFFTASNIVDINGIWTVKKMQMVMTQGGKMIHASVYDVKDIKYDVPYQDEIFTTHALGKGLTQH